MEGGAPSPPGRGGGVKSSATDMLEQISPTTSLAVRIGRVYISIRALRSREIG